MYSISGAIDTYRTERYHAGVGKFEALKRAIRFEIFGRLYSRKSNY